MIEIQTTSEIFDWLCGNAYTDEIREPDKKWISYHDIIPKLELINKQRTHRDLKFMLINLLKDLTER